MNIERRCREEGDFNLAGPSFFVLQSKETEVI